MQARFKQISKKQNSTKRPTGLQLYNVTLKGPCSILKPRLEIKWNGTGDPTLYNMVYISTFGRYYWITNWTYEDRCWVCDCRVDVLATYKTEIGNSRFLILRAADVVATVNALDSYYPAAGVGTVSRVGVWGGGTGPAIARTYDDGKFVVGVIGQGNTFNAGGTGYVVVNGNGMQAILDAAFTGAQNLWPSSLGTNIGDVFAAYGDLLQKSMKNPFQFINSVMWVPFAPTTSGVTPLKLGTLATNIPAPCLSDPVISHSWSVNYSPTQGGLDLWRNMAPYARYALELPPFGSVELDSALINQSGSLGYSLNFDMKTDVTTGVSYLRVSNGAGATLWTTSAQLGIQIPINGVMTDAANVLSQSIGNIGGIIGAVMQPSAASITNAITGVGNTIKAAQPQAVCGGQISTGLAALNGSKTFSITTYDVIDEDPDHIGRIYCQVDTISNHSGYLVCADGDLDISGTPEEMAEIKSYLTGGFYYE